MAAKKEPAVQPAAASDKKKALETAMQQIEKMYGKGSIMRLGENAGVVVDAIPTGSLSLDLALGIGGLPKGRIIEIYGPESSGKTTLAAKIQEKTRCGVIHMDDFFLRPEQRTKERLAQAGGNIDWERIKKEALEPIRANSAALYRPYDCHTQSFKEQIKIEPGPLIVFEGSYLSLIHI